MKKKRLGLAVDIDGVISNIGKGLEKILSGINGKEIKHKDIITYNLELWGLPKYSHKKFFNKEFYETLEPIKDSREVINCLYEDNYIVLVTARDQYPNVMNDTFKWLINNGFLCDELIQTRNKTGPMKHYNLDFLIDDFYGNCFDLAKEGHNSLLFEQPWNKYISFGSELEHKHIKRVKDWKHITEYLKQIRVSNCREVLE